MTTEIAPPESELPDPRKRRREMRALWRVSVWGGAAAIALAVVAITTQTDSGSARLQNVLAQESQPVRTVTLAAIKPHVIDPDTLRLEAQIRVLTADRDRLTARIASLEHNLDDMTGSIKRQAAQFAAASAAKTPAPSPPATAPQVVAAAPALSAPAASPTPPVITPPAAPVTTGIAEPLPATPPAQAATPAPEPVPLPPVRVAAAPASEPAAEPPRKPELGVDIGGAPSLAVLSARWAAVKANFGPMLTGLRPLAAHNHHSGATDYRLVVGPLPTVAAAVQLCSRLGAARITCKQAKFDGENLASR